MSKVDLLEEARDAAWEAKSLAEDIERLLEKAVSEIDNFDLDTTEEDIRNVSRYSDSAKNLGLKSIRDLKRISSSLDRMKMELEDLSGAFSEVSNQISLDIDDTEIEEDEEE